VVITIITMIITCSITWYVPTSLSLHTLSIEVSARVSSIIQNQTRAFSVAVVLCSMAGSAGVEALLSRHGELGLAMAGEQTTQAMLGGWARRTDRRAEQVAVGE